MVVQHNITAINANRYYGINNNKLAKSLEKLSSGYAINRAGDNAAGLAVSEKMRSQIAGINQGVKNAQDGISMIQTFEGALTETDSILQRMKVLADQSANGTYQNEVDRDAIQLEFNQLNDELNQIADTDFNGVVVLNGGRMADGLQAVDGKFDYSMKADQVAAENSEKLVQLQADAQAKIDAANKAVAAAQKKLDNTKIDLSNAGAAKEWNTVDNNKYDAKMAELVFGKASADNGVTPGTGGLTDADGKNLADYGATEVTVTFEYDGAGNWTGIKATAVDSNGDAIEIANPEFLAGTDNPGTGTGLGGFNVKADGTDTTVNAIFDSTAAKKGDTVTLVFTNSASETVAPANIGMDANSLDKTDLKGVAPADPTIAVNVADSDMTQEISDALKTLDKSFVKVTYNGANAPSFELMDENDAALSSSFKIDGGVITYTTAEGKDVTLATVTAAAGKEKSDTTTKAVTANDADNLAAATGGSVTFTWDGTAWKDSAGNATAVVGTKTATTTAADITVDPADYITAGTKPLNIGDTITITATVAEDTANAGKVKISTAATLGLQDATSGSVKFGIAVDAFNYSSDGGYTVKAGKDTAINSENGVLAQKALDKAKAELKAAQDAYPTELPQGVSKSDAYDQATAPLTYTDHIMLQAGPRTKDLVDFTFKYTSQGLGDLKADLDCSARGLGTDKLSLATQEEANYAIDRIDNAINKTNMVRSTFGAVQNRLEHKIDNLNVTSENLTSAESRIRDTNMAEEMMNFTKNQILSQASQSMLAQANQLPQGVLSLLQ